MTALPQTTMTVQFAVRGQSVGKVERRAAEYLAQVVGPEYDASQWQVILTVSPADEPQAAAWDDGGIPPTPTWWEGSAVASRLRR